MNILMVASEAAPFLISSGIANVVSELTLQLRRMQHDARIVIPHYRTTDSADAKLVLDRLEVPLGSMKTECRISRLDVELSSQQAVPFYLVGHQFYFDRESAYGYADDYERFICFTRAVLEMLCQSEFASDGWMPDVIHGHDWIAGLMPSWLRHTYAADEKIAPMGFVYTIHNAGFSGQCSSRSLALAGLAEQGVYLDLGETESTINFMARGVLAADAVNTVSPHHALELQNGEYASDIEKAILASPNRIVGILNGVDDNIFNPTWDETISKRFDVRHLDWRAANRVELQRICSLNPTSERPIFGMVSRLIEEKGYGLIEETLPQLFEEDRAQFVLLGRPGDHHFRESFKRIQRLYPDRMFVRFGVDDELARCIFAGCDVVMIPSLHEPCGLQQILAMRYGALPLVRRTGGLADTVRQWNAPPERSAVVGQGFVFEDFSIQSLRQAMREATNLYRNQRRKWRELQSENMELDFSWRAPAREYEALYSQALQSSRSRVPIPTGTVVIPDRSDLLVQTLLALNELMITASSADYLIHVAEAARELLHHDAVLIWTLDGETPERLKLAAASPTSIPVPKLYQEHNARTWSRQYIYRTDENEVATGGLRAQRGFLSSDMAISLGWKTQLTAPISARGVLQGRIDAFSMNPHRQYTDWYFTALTALANTVGVSLERRQIRAQRVALLELDRKMTEAKTVRDLVKVVLSAAAEATSADAVVLQLAEGADFYFEDGQIHETKRDASMAFAAHDSIPISLQTTFSEPLGRLEVFRKSQLFSRRHSEVLQELCLQAAGTLAAALQRERDEKARVDQLRKLAESLEGGEDDDTFLQRIIETTAKVLQAKAASLYLVEVDGEKERLRIRAATGYHEPLLKSNDRAEYLKGEGLTGSIWQSGEKFKADNLEQLHRPGWRGKYKSLQGEIEPRGFMGLPLKIVDRFTQQPKVIGVLKFEDRSTGEEQAFTDQDFLLAEMMANIIATAVHNARVSGAQFQKLSRDLGELSKALVGGQDMQGLVQGVVEKMAETLNAGASSLYLYDQTTGLLEIRAATGYQKALLTADKKVSYAPGEGVTGWIFQKNEVVRANSLRELRAHPAHKGKQNPHQSNLEPESFLGLPLTVTDRFTKEPRVIGVLKVEQIQPTPAHREAVFTTQDERLVVMMANVIATVVYNTHVSVSGLHKMSKDLGSLSAALAGGRDLNDLVVEVADTMATVLGVEASSLYLYDKVKRALVIRAATGYQKVLLGKGAAYQPGEGITGWIFNTGKSVRVNSLSELRRHPAWKGKQNEEQGKQPNTFLGLPLKVTDRFSGEEKVIGVLKVEEIIRSQNHPETWFTDQDVALVTMMASVIAAVVFNTEVAAEQLEERFKANMEALSKALVGGQEMKTLVKRVVDTIANVLGAEASSLYLFDDATQQLVIQAAMGYQEPLVRAKVTYLPGEGITGSIYRDGEPRRADSLEQLRKLPGWKGSKNQLQGGREPNSFLGLPLRAGDRVIGVLKVEDIRSSPKHPEERFTDQDILLVTMMANVIATVVSNTREGDARVGDVLRRLGTLSGPQISSRELLQEYCRRGEEGIVDQMATALADYLDAHPERIDAEAEALLAARANAELFSRIAERAKDAGVRWKFSLYACLLKSFPPFVTWQEFLQAAQPWMKLKAVVDKPIDFGEACAGVAMLLAQATGLQAGPCQTDARNTWFFCQVDTGGKLGDEIGEIPIFFLRKGSLDLATRTALKQLLADLTTAWRVMHLVDLDGQATSEEIEELRKIPILEQGLLVSNRDDLIRIVGSQAALEGYRRLVFRRLPAKLLFVREGSVPDHMFFGRTKEIAEIMGQIRADRSCILIGGRKVGKTSVLKRLLRASLPAEGYTIIFASLDDITSPAQFLAKRIGRHSWIPSPPENAPETFGQLLAWPPAKVVLLLDEVDPLIDGDREAGWRVFREIRAKVNEESLRVVLSGMSELRAACDDDRDPEGPLRNFGHHVELGPLEQGAVWELVTRPFGWMEVELVDSQSLLRRIYEFTHGHPSVVQRMCTCLAAGIGRTASSVRQITPQDVEDVIRDAAFVDRDYLNVLWSTATPLEVVISLLMARTRSLRYFEDIHGEVRRTSKLDILSVDVKTALTDLEKLRLILQWTESAGYEFVLTSFPEVVKGDLANELLLIHMERLRQWYPRRHHG